MNTAPMYNDPLGDPERRDPGAEWPPPDDGGPGAAFLPIPAVDEEDPVGAIPPDPIGHEQDPPGRAERLKLRIRRDVREAMIDPDERPTGDFGLASGRSTDAHDHIAPFSGLVTAMRLATIAVSLLLAMNEGGMTDGLRIWTAVIVAYAVFRAFKPLRLGDDLSSLLGLVGEIALHVFAIVLTGGWDSPLVVTLLTPVALAGLAKGFGFGLRIAIASVVAVSLPFLAESPDPREAVLRSASWAVIVLIVAVISGYARRISGEAIRERELALDRLSRLSDANTLLFSLHRVTQTLPASLDLDDVLDSTVSRMKSLVGYDAIAVLLFDETDGSWQVSRHHGLHTPSHVRATDLPPAMRRALADNRPVYVPDLPTDGGGMWERAGSGIYTVMSARGSVIGLLAIEHGDLDHFNARDLELIEGFVAPASLAVDNARWFARLRTVGADEERTRIARDLHDRIGQSLAYLAFELDHIVELDNVGDPVTAEIGQLREDVRGVIREVRDTLYDLRTDVSDTQGLAEVLEQYAERVSERSGMSIQVDADHEARLPLLQEREMWRVAQEALANVERHAGATAVRVLWRCDGRRALIDVTDNGVGFEQGRAGRLDSYGVLGMRERAASIGATLELVSAPGRGTRVRCVVDPQSNGTNGMGTASGGTPQIDASTEVDATGADRVLGV